MPEFNTYVDVDVYEIWDSCSRSEKEELVDLLEEEGFAKRIIPRNGKKERMSFMEEDHMKHCDILSNSYHRMSLDEIEMIRQLAKKYEL